MCQLPSSSSCRRSRRLLEKKMAQLDVRLPVLKLHNVRKYMWKIGLLRPNVYSAREVMKSILDEHLKTVPSPPTSEESSIPDPVITTPSVPIRNRRPRKQVRRDPATVARVEYDEDEWWRKLLVPKGGKPVLSLFNAFQKRRKRYQVKIKRGDKTLAVKSRKK